jgi:hypothetical protein
MPFLIILIALLEIAAWILGHQVLQVRRPHKNGNEETGKNDSPDNE